MRFSVSSHTKAQSDHEHLINSNTNNHTSLRSPTACSSKAASSGTAKLHKLSLASSSAATAAIAVVTVMSTTGKFAIHDVSSLIQQK
jgi:hypothetical protein